MMDMGRARKLQHSFDEAEERLKLVQLRAGCEIPVRCVDELRGGCRHALAYVVSGAKNEYDEALKCCDRAYFDACEFEMIFYLRTFKQLQGLYGDMVIPPVIPDYLKWREVYQDAKDFISLHSQHKTRYKVREQCLVHAEALHRINKLLPSARDDLDKQRNELETSRANLQELQKQLVRAEKVAVKRQRHIKRLHWVGIVLAAVALVAGVLAGIYADELKNYFRPTSSTTQSPQ
jgi:hypothetical protein